MQRYLIEYQSPLRLFWENSSNIESTAEVLCICIQLKPRNLDELECFATEEWARIHQETCTSLAKSYRERLLSVVQQGGHTIVH